MLKRWSGVDWYLMKDLAGYRKWFWTTSFTNYRFAIPHYAGSRGRAIYNDEDQIYLGDPGELFDVDMGDHGYLLQIQPEIKPRPFRFRVAARQPVYPLLSRS